MTDPTLPAAEPVATGDPGRALGIVALVLAFVASLLGLILGIAARSMSAKAGYRNAPARAAIVIAGIITVLWVGLGIAGLTIGAGHFEELAQQCDQLGPGVHEIDGERIVCT